MVKVVQCAVVGAGPGGLAAATAAARAGRRVLLLDDNPQVGGQIWRRGLHASQAGVQAGEAADERRRLRAVADLRQSGAEFLNFHRVFDAPEAGVLHALHEPTDGSPSITRVRYETVVMATGARERFLPFPGWTLPGVFGAGGLQAMVTGGFTVAGKRVVVAGTGPLLLAVAAHLRHAGATVVCLAEQAPARQLLPFAFGLCRQPGKLLQGLRYRLVLNRTSFRIGTWPVAATGHETQLQLKSVSLSNGRRIWDEPCDLLACGFHLVPNTELAQLLGCALDGDFVAIDSRQETSIPGVFCVGEATGIAGIDAAVVQGEIAGRVCAGASTRRLQRRARSQRSFRRRLAHAFALANGVAGTAATGDHRVPM